MQNLQLSRESNARPDGTGFPFHKLTADGFGEVFKHLDLIDIFELSFTSKLVRDSIIEARDTYPVKSLKILYHASLPSIELHTATNSLLWTFGYPEDLPMEYAGEYQIGRYTYKCQKSFAGFHTEHYDIEEGFRGIIMYFISIFNFKNTIITELLIDLGGIIEDIRTICSYFIKFNKIERLSIRQCVPNEEATLNFNLNFDWIMENFKMNDIYLGMDGVENVLIKKNGELVFMQVPKRYNKALKIDHICCKYSEWICPDDLLKLDAKTAIFQSSSLTERDLNEYIKAWLKSDSNKLNWLEVQVNGTCLKKEVITSGLTLQPDTYRLENTSCSCPYRRFDSMTPTPFIFPNDSKQITRSTDSTTATISITHDTFFFHIRNYGPVTPPTPPEPRRQIFEHENEEMLEPREIIRLENMRGRRVQFIGDNRDDDDLDLF